MYGHSWPGILGRAPQDSPRKPRKTVFGGIFADADAIAAVKFGDAPSY